MTDKAFEHWAIVEVFGHQTYAGLVSEQSIGGSSFVRIDVPDLGEQKGFTKLFGQNAIYGITIVDEETAKLKAAALKMKPINAWEVGSLVRDAVQQKLLEARNVDEMDDFDDPDEQEF